MIDRCPKSRNFRHRTRRCRETTYCRHNDLVMDGVGGFSFNVDLQLLYARHRVNIELVVMTFWVFRSWLWGQNCFRRQFYCWPEVGRHTECYTHSWSAGQTVRTCNLGCGQNWHKRHAGHEPTTTTNGSSHPPVYIEHGGIVPLYLIVSFFRCPLQLTEEVGDFTWQSSTNKATTYTWPNNRPTDRPNVKRPTDHSRCLVVNRVCCCIGQRPNKVNSSLDLISSEFFSASKTDRLKLTRETPLNRQGVFLSMDSNEQCCTAIRGSWSACKASWRFFRASAIIVVLITEAE
jgi:hypothetical protein